MRTSGSATARCLRAAAPHGIAMVVSLCIALAGASAPAAAGTLAPRHLLRASGLTSLYAGGPGSLSVALVERDPGEKDAPERPVPGATVTVLLDSGATLFTGKTDATGALVARFTVPDGVTGAHRLRVVSAHADGEQSLLVDVDVRAPSDERLLHLATDKPMYQPTQTIHLRALLVRATDLHALAGVGVVFEVRAPGGVLVHRAEVPASPLGVASSEIALGPEVPLGAYEVSATSGSTKVARTVTVSKYELAASKVEVDLDRPYYRLGDRVVAKIKATYSFGKPVAGASLDINLSASPYGTPISLFRTYATTDADGRFTFDYRLPTEHYALGKGFARAPLSIDVVATDRGGETIVASEASTIAEDVLMTKVVPGRDPLVAGVANPVYVIVHYPDGKPAADCAVRAGAYGEAITGAAGIARFDITPKPGETSVSLELADAYGNRASTSASLRAERAGLVVRAERSLYGAKDEIAFDVLVPEAARGSGFVHLEVARRGLLVDSFIAPVAGGRAHVTMAPRDDGWGTLVATAHVQVGKELWSGTGAVYVLPARALTVSMGAGPATYLPGADATLALDVKDEAGAGVPAAIMVKIVDERLYALEDAARERLLMYFTLAEALRKPDDPVLAEAARVGFGASLTKEEAEKAAKAEAAARDLAAGVLLARFGGAGAAGDLFAADSDAQSKARASDELHKLADALRTARPYYFYEGKIGRPIDWLVKHGGLAKDSAVDVWGRGYRIEGHGLLTVKYRLVSVGPDGERGTRDDLAEELFE